MRIGYISLFYGGGGTGSHVYKISNVMARFGHEVTVFTVYQNVDPPDGVSVVKFYLPFKRGFSYIWNLQFNHYLHKHIKKGYFDILHGNPVSSNFSKIAKKVGIPYVITLQGSMLGVLQKTKNYMIYNNPSVFIDRFYSWINSHIEKNEFLNSDFVISVSKSVLREYFQFYDKREKCEVIPNCFDTSIFRRLSVEESTYTQFGLSRQDTHLIYVGTFIQRKGIHLLLESMKSLTKDYKNVQLLLIGGSTKNYFTRFIKKYNLQKNIKFFNWIEPKKLVNLLNLSDIFVFPSLYEGGFQQWC